MNKCSYFGLCTSLFQKSGIDHYSLVGGEPNPFNITVLTFLLVANNATLGS